jgi:hypothetical protein
VLPLPLILPALLVACSPEPEAASPAEAAFDDGFLLGVNYPWRNYGGDFGENAWGRYGVASDLEPFDDDFRVLADAGVEVVRWFVFTDGRASPEFDADGVPTGLDEAAWEDLDAAVDLAEAHGLLLVPVLLDFHWFAPAEDLSGVQMGGRGGVMADPEMRAALVDNAVLPVLQRYGDSPGILAWDVINEPEWAMDGLGEESLGGSIPAADVQAFVSAVAELVATETEHGVTVGSAGARHLPTYWWESELDLLQLHWYGGPLAEAAMACDDRPCVVGEFGTSPEYGSLTDSLDAVAAAGFTGAWPWSFRADDVASDLDMDAFADWAAGR